MGFFVLFNFTFSFLLPYVLETSDSTHIGLLAKERSWRWPLDNIWYWVTCFECKEARLTLHTTLWAWVEILRFLYKLKLDKVLEERPLMAKDCLRRCEFWIVPHSTDSCHRLGGKSSRTCSLLLVHNPPAPRPETLRSGWPDIRQAGTRVTLDSLVSPPRGSAAPWTPPRSSKSQGLWPPAEGHHCSYSWGCFTF